MGAKNKDLHMTLNLNTSQNEKSNLDISINEIKALKDRELLIIELNHTNIRLQANENIANNMSIVMLSGIAILVLNLINGFIYLFNYFQQNQNLEYLNATLPFIFIVLFVTVPLGILIIFFDSKNKTKIINRKSLILDELKKNFSK